MTFLDFPIGTDDIDRRLDRVVRKFLKTIPLSGIYKNLRSGFMRVNGKKVKSDYRMLAGDIINIEKNLFESSESSPQEVQVDMSQVQRFETIFENDHIKIINKPFGVNVQASSKDDVSLDKIIKNEFLQGKKETPQNNSLSFLPGPLHRLDKNTTGALVFSQSLQGARVFSELMESKKIHKVYMCILSGKLTDKCTWEHSIEKESKLGSGNFVTVQVHEISNNSNNTRNAKTYVEPIAHGKFFDENITLAFVTIETGRTHQIRSQASFCGYPLLGDIAYNYTGKAKQFFLHAWVLEFPQETKIGLPLKVIADLPTSFKEFIKNHLPNTTIPSYNVSR